MADLRGLRLDPQTVIILLIFVALFGVGYVVGNYKGTKHVEAQIIEQGGQAQSLTGTVKSTNDGGFVLKTDKDEWTVKFGKSVSGKGPAGRGSSDDQDVKKGDEVQVSGTPIGKNALVAQSVTKVVQPTPQPSQSPTNR